MTLDTIATAPKPDRRAQILDSAESRARRGGYKGFSFREVAADVGLRSASVHHHFPTKADLACALVARYGERFRAELGAPGAPGALSRLIGAYRAQIHERDAMCLCTVLGAEIDVLPDGVADTLRAHVSGLVDWAEEALGEEGSRPGAETLVAGLAGALLTARAVGDAAMFDRMAGGLLDAARGQPRPSSSA